MNLCPRFHNYYHNLGLISISNEAKLDMTKLSEPNLAVLIQLTEQMSIEPSRLNKSQP